MCSNRRVATRSLALVLRPLLLVLLGWGCWMGDASAQLYSIRHRPTDVSYYRYERPPFTYIYQAGLLSEARETARLLEEHLPAANALVGLRRPLRMPVVLNNFTDRANGYVSPLPFRQEIESAHLRGKTLSPRFGSWLETVAPHELVHAAHAESGSGFGVGWLLRRLGPDLARSLNLSGPRGINEGAAVWLESRVRPNAGRLNYSLFNMEFRAAMLSDDPWSLVQMLEAPRYTRPFDRYYHGGAHLFEYLLASGREDFFSRARNLYYRFPLWGYGPALWYGARMRLRTLERQLLTHYIERASAFQNSVGETTEATVVASERGTVFRRPRWLDDRTLVAYASGYSIRPGFYRIDVETGARRAISYQAVTEDYFWSFDADSSGILFSRYVPSMSAPVEAIADLFRLDLDTGRVTRVSHGGRLFAAVPASNGALWALMNITQFNEWVEVPLLHPRVGGDYRVGKSTSEPRAVGRFERGRIVAIEPGPLGRQVAVIVNEDGRQGVYRTDARTFETGDLSTSLEPTIHLQDATVFDVNWTPDGRYLILSADAGDVANIYAYDLTDERLVRRTNVPFGAIEPAVSPDGSRLAYVNYRHERFELVITPLRSDEDENRVEAPKDAGGPLRVSAKGADDSRLREQDAGVPSGVGRDRVVDRDHSREHSADIYDGTRGGSSVEAEPEPYRPLLHVRPRVLYPFLLYQRPTGDEQDTNLGFGAGVGIEWADPLQYWSAQTHAFYQHRAVWGRVAVRSGYLSLRPGVEVFRLPSTVFVVRRMSDGRVDTVRVGRDERGIGASIQSPLVFVSNVYQTNAHLSLRGEYRQERLFDDDNRSIARASDFLTLRPSLNLAYRVQANPRDIVPNSGLIVSLNSRFDVWGNRGRASRWFQANAAHHIPLLHQHNIGIQMKGDLLTQNRGGIMDLTTFFPRGYETDETFLDDGTYVKYGIEYTQPLLYIDDGWFIIPLYFEALFAYAFAETMHPISRATGDRISVAGAGFGLQFRFAHSIGATLRFAPVYKFNSREWSVTFR